MTPETARVPARRAPISLKSAVFVLLSLIGFVFYGLFDKQVFPAASIDLKLSPADAEQKSRQIARDIGYDIAGAKRVTTFSEDDDAKTVLEFKQGIDKANQLMKNQVPVWLWRTRYCRELSKDELVVVWTTEGLFKSVFHTFENDRKFPTISQEKAQALATKFVTDTAALDLAGYELYDQGAEKMPNRTDYHFVWRKPGFTESEFRIKVEVAGNQISTCRYWLAPSDSWDREYKGIRQWNELLGTLASLLLFLFIATTIGAFIYGISKHNIRWRFTLISSGVVAILTLLESLNNFNYALESYDTSVTYAQFLLQTAFKDLLECVGAFVFSVLLVGGAEVVYRLTRPGETAMQYLASWRGMAKDDYAGKVVIGYLLVGIMMFWTIAYYKMGQKLGYFCPLGVDDYKVLGNFCPAISGALIGVSAAGLEEFTCRVVGLGLLQKLTKNFWLANFLQAIIWGFAHSTYPQEPCYARGVELTVVGLLFGYIVKNFGVLPCFVAHYLYDAFLTVEPVFASHKVELIVPALLILVPFIVATWFSRKKMAAEKVAVESIDLTNAHQSGLGAEHENEAAHTDHSADPPPPYKTLSAGRRKALLLLTAFGLLSLAIPASDSIGKDKKVVVSAVVASARAEHYLTEDGLAHKDFYHVAQLTPRPDSSKDTLLVWQYLYEKLGLRRTKEIYNQAAPGLEWQVHFFKPGQSKSYDVYMNGDGSRRTVAITDLDEAPGAKLDDASALGLMQSYIEKNRPEFEPCSLDTKSKVVQAKRIDYSFDFIVPKFAVGDVPAILHADLKGNEVSTMALDWKVPDQWLWPRKQMRLQQQIAVPLRIGTSIAVIICALLWSVNLLRTTRVPWRLALSIGAIWSVLAFVGIANGAIKSLSSYNTAEDFQNFLLQTLFSQATKLLLETIACFLISIAGCAALQKYFFASRIQLHSWVLLRTTSLDQRQVRKNLWLDAAISAYSFCAALAVLRCVQELLARSFSPDAPLSIPNRVAALFCTSFPGLEICLSVLSYAVGFSLGLAFMASFWKRFFSSTKMSALVIFVMAVVWGLDSFYWQNCLIDIVFMAFRGFLILYFVSKIFRGNVLAYLLSIVVTFSALYLGELVSYAPRVAGGEIFFLALLLVAPAFTAMLFSTSASVKGSNNDTKQE